MILNNKIALVTGSGVRLGQAIAFQLGRMGMRVALHYHQSEEGAKETARELPGGEAENFLFQADLRDVSQIERMVDEIEEKAGPISVLINNAADFFPTPLFSTTEEDWDQLYSLNLKAPFFLTQAVSECMKKRGEGKIINLVDVSGERPWTGFLPYCGTKAGLISLTKGFAKALAPEIQVNGIAPGTVLTPPDHTEMDYNLSIEHSLLKRIGSAEDIMKAVQYLIESDFVTGTIMPVDGGRSVY